MRRSHFQIILFLAAVLAVGALIAPPLYWAGKWLASLVVSFKQTDTPVIGWIGQKFAAHQFDNYFNRAFLFSALGLLWPFLKWMKLSGDPLGLEPNPRRWSDAFVGFVLAAGFLALLTAVLLSMKAYLWEEKIKWASILPRAVLSGIVVAFLEEWLFRKVFLGVALRSSRRWMAILLVSALFSILHLMKAPDIITREPHQREAAFTVLRGPGWSDLTESLRTRPQASDWMIAKDYKPFAYSRIHAGSGFAMTAEIFKRNFEPTRFTSEFMTLFVIGLILAHARCATRSLALPIGLHAGWIFSNVLCSGVTSTSPALNDGQYLFAVGDVRIPLIGTELKIGLLPLVTLVATALALQIYLRMRKPPPPES